MDSKEYEAVCDSLSLKKLLLPFDLIVLDLSTKTEYCLNKAYDSKGVFTIVLDQKYEDIPMNYPNNYYCNTLDEVKIIASFVIDHPTIYTSTLEDFDTLTTITE